MEKQEVTLKFYQTKHIHVRRMVEPNVRGKTAVLDHITRSPIALQVFHIRRKITNHKGQVEKLIMKVHYFFFKIYHHGREKTSQGEGGGISTHRSDKKLIFRIKGFYKSTML